MKLFGEVINVFDRENIRANYLGGFDPRTNNLVPEFEKTFPTLPSVGVVIDF